MTTVGGQWFKSGIYTLFGEGYGLGVGATTPTAAQQRLASTTTTENATYGALRAGADELPGSAVRHGQRAYRREQRVRYATEEHDLSERERLVRDVGRVVVPEDCARRSASASAAPSVRRVCRRERPRRCTFLSTLTYPSAGRRDPGPRAPAARQPRAQAGSHDRIRRRLRSRHVQRSRERRVHVLQQDRQERDVPEATAAVVRHGRRIAEGQHRPRRQQGLRAVDRCATCSTPATSRGTCGQRVAHQEQARRHRRRAAPADAGHAQLRRLSVVRSVGSSVHVQRCERRRRHRTERDHARRGRRVPRLDAAGV